MAAKGVLANGKMVSLVKPANKGVKVPGTVRVKVFIDEDGNILTPEPLSGPVEHYEASIEAAKKCKFSPTTLYGLPLKVYGIIDFNFQ
jgi:hypothetical protein